MGMKKDKTFRIVQAALFAALVFVGTFVIKIPTPGTGGYVHPGDAFVILSGIFLGPLYGALAAGIGSALADLIGGYLVYVPITFVIKALIGLFSGLIFVKWGKALSNNYLKVVLCGIADIVLVAGGYLVFELFIYGTAAVASVPANIIQGVAGLIISLILYPVVSKIKEMTA